MSKYNKFIATLEGIINGVKVTLQGSGECSDVLGVVDGTYTTSNAVKGFDPLVFNAFIITGYPSESRSIGSAMNPFKQTNYSYDRTVKFEDGKEIDLYAECIFKNGILESQFKLKGESKISALVAIEPLVETWIPVTKNRIDGFFTMVWRTKSGKYTTGRAHTKYHIPNPSAILDTVHHRWIKIAAKGTAKSFTRYQVSELWKGSPFPLKTLAT